MNVSLKRFTLLALAVLIFGTVGLTAVAQVQPTAEQMRLINQLPPAQRQQALQAIRQMQSQGGSSAAGGQPSSINEPLQQPSSSDQPMDLLADSEFEELQAGARSRIVVTLTPSLELSAEEQRELDRDPVLSRLSGSHYYELNDFGVLILPGLAEIPLLGLTAEGVEQRLGAEPALEVFTIFAVLLEVKPTGAEALSAYGYDIFESTTGGFDSVTVGPVPPDYVLGPGDSIRVQLFGNVNGIYEFEVGRDGVLNLPEIGPVTVAGLPFSEFREDLRNRVREMLIGTQVSVSMGQLRTIRVFVLGDANRPGSYVVSSLATISSTLYRSGGISDVGTLRDIQLKRNGKIVSRLDLYDLLLKGDNSADQRLQPGDVIFVPPVGNTVSIAGAVRRPAIYEIEGKASLDDLVRLAGGLLPDAYPAGIRLERINSDRQRVVLSVDAGSGDGRNSALKTGDILTVPSVLPELYGSVELTGHVHRPGAYQWRPAMTLTDLITSVRALMPRADAEYVVIRREAAADRHIEILSANLDRALEEPSSPENIRLQERDTVFVFSLEFGRQRVIGPILDELGSQAQFGSPINEVRVNGQIRAPGRYPLEPGMRISDLVRAGGNLVEGAFAQEAELTRFDVIGGVARTKEVLEVNLDAVLQGDASADLPLAPHDLLSISQMPDWDSNWSVTVEGEVRFPGEYQILRNETLAQLLERAGGLTEGAFPQGAIFLRESLREREREQIAMLAARMEADLTSLSLESLDTTGSEALRTGQGLLDQLRNAEPVGRLVIDLEQVLARVGVSTDVGDLQLKDNDRLLIPTAPQEVTVIGEAQQPTSHLFQPGFTRDDYIELSGGLTRRADRKLIYVVRASGAVIAGERSRWFGRGNGGEIRPGDTIVVPLETDRMRPLTFWGSVTQILYQAAIAVAAVQTFSN